MAAVAAVAWVVAVVAAVAAVAWVASRRPCMYFLLKVTDVDFALGHHGNYLGAFSFKDTAGLPSSCACADSSRRSASSGPACSGLDRRCTIAFESLMSTG